MENIENKSSKIDGISKIVTGAANKTEVAKSTYICTYYTYIEFPLLERETRQGKLSRGPGTILVSQTAVSITTMHD